MDVDSFCSLLSDVGLRVIAIEFIILLAKYRIDKLEAEWESLTLHEKEHRLMGVNGCPICITPRRKDADQKQKTCC